MIEAVYIIPQYKIKITEKIIYRNTFCANSYSKKINLIPLVALKLGHVELSAAALSSQPLA